MPFAYFLLLNGGNHLNREREHPDAGRHILAALAYFPRDFHMLEIELVGKALECPRALHDAQVLALKVFYDGNLKLYPRRNRARVAFPYEDRHLKHPRKLCRAGPSFSRDKFVIHLKSAVCARFFMARYHQRLET